MFRYQINTYDGGISDNVYVFNADSYDLALKCFYDKLAEDLEVELYEQIVKMDRGIWRVIAQYRVLHDWR